MPLIFITGPVRSGKSRYALRLANESGRPVTFLATAARYEGDEEWTQRLERHRSERPPHWRTIESAGLAHSELLTAVAQFRPDETVVVDAMGTYLAARFDEHLRIAGGPAGLDVAVEREAASFSRALVACPAYTIVVGEQVGWDVVPEQPSARTFRDILGRMQATLATAAQTAYLVVAGHALNLTHLGTPILRQAQDDTVSP